MLIVFGGMYTISIKNTKYSQVNLQPIKSNRPIKRKIHKLAVEPSVNAEHNPTGPGSLHQIDSSIRAVNQVENSSEFRMSGWSHDSVIAMIYSEEATPLKKRWVLVRRPRTFWYRQVNSWLMVIASSRSSFLI